MVEYARWPRCLTAVTGREDASNLKSNEPRCGDEPKRRSLPSVAHLKLWVLGNMMQGTIACFDARILSSGSQAALELVLSEGVMTFIIRASKNGQSVVTVRISPAVAVDKARVLESLGWQVHVADSAE